MRTGDEPITARSPLRLRLGLALFGLATSVLAVVVLVGRVIWPVVAAFAVVAVLAAVDAAVVARRLRQGAHFQPGPAIPPYRPVDPPVPQPRVRRQVGEGTRLRRYLAIMGTCLLLITLAWTVVRGWSTTAAVLMSAVAAVLPPIAAIVANFGVELPVGGGGPEAVGRSGGVSEPPIRPQRGGLEN